jgi:hypothetical protein
LDLVGVTHLNGWLDVHSLAELLELGDERAFEAIRPALARIVERAVAERSDSVAVVRALIKQEMKAKETFAVPTLTPSPLVIDRVVNRLMDWLLILAGADEAQEIETRVLGDAYRRTTVDPPLGS